VYQVVLQGLGKFSWPTLCMLESSAIENFRKYLKIKTVHPNPDYAGALKFLKDMANEIGLELQVIEVRIYTHK
jgi:predicted ATP-grasp superfamily ATP-dependent carboligase